MTKKWLEHKVKNKQHVINPLTIQCTYTYMSLVFVLVFFSSCSFDTFLGILHCSNWSLSSYLKNIMNQGVIIFINPKKAFTFSRKKALLWLRSITVLWSAWMHSSWGIHYIFFFILELKIALYFLIIMIETLLRDDSSWCW